MFPIKLGCVCALWNNEGWVENYTIALDTGIRLVASFLRSDIGIPSN